MKKLLFGIVVAGLICVSPAARAGGSSQLGAGVYYWKALEDLDSRFEENGLSYYASYQYKPGFVGFEADLELQPDRFDENAYAPQAYLVVGETLYAAAGIGILYTDGDFADEPFYVFKAGLDLEVLPSLHLDISANYRFNDRADLSNDATDVDTDTVFLGAALRLEF